MTDPDEPRDGALLAVDPPRRSLARLAADLVGTIGEWVIYGLIWAFGRRRETGDLAWLVGPLGGATIGDRSYEETAVAEGLVLERNSREGGLIPRFDALAGPDFDAARVHPKIRDFYERTPAYRFDTWATTYFPARLALWALVHTISRRVQQLNFPLDGIETAHGMRSEIVLLRRPDGSIQYTGWFRTLEGSGRVIYTGYYMTDKPPLCPGPCVKVVFPMPDGNATVLLRPENDGGSGLRLASIGTPSATPDSIASSARVRRYGSGGSRACTRRFVSTSTPKTPCAASTMCASSGCRS